MEQISKPGEVLLGVVLHKDFGLAQFVSIVHLEPEEEQSTIIHRQIHRLVEIKRQKLVPGGKKRFKIIGQSSSIRCPSHLRMNSSIGTRWLNPF